MRAYLLIVLLFIQANLIAIAQVRLGYLELRGSVHDAKGNAVYGASILFVEHVTGTISRLDGRFTVSLPRKSFTMVVSHVGFETYYANISPTDTRITTEGLLTLDILLEEKVRMLRQVDILGEETALKPEKLLDQSGHFVIDFQFSDDFLVLLVRKGKSKVLQKRHLYLDTLLFETEVDMRYDTIFKDCTGNLHLLSPKKGVQIFPLKDRFHFYQEYSMEMFNKVIRNCIQNYNTNYVFVRRAGYNQVAFYYSILSDSSIAIPLKTIHDEMAMHYADDYSNSSKQNAFKYKWKTYGNSGSGSNASFMYVNQNEEFVRKAFYKFILTKPIFGTLIRLNNQFFIFDPIKDSVFCFNERSIPLGASSMRFHNQKHWSKWIETDADHLKVYTRFDIRGQYYLSEINPYSGELINRYELYERYYPERLKIKDGAAYYIKMVDNRRVLFRQQLENGSY